MAKHYHSQFDERQEMQTSDFEIFYYEDKEASDVSMHRHDYYEIYFFLEGDLSYQIGKNIYPLQYGDICLIPPGVFIVRSFTAMTSLTAVWCFGCRLTFLHDCRYCIRILPTVSIMGIRSPAIIFPVTLPMHRFSLTN